MPLWSNLAKSKSTIPHLVAIALSYGLLVIICTATVFEFLGANLAAFINLCSEETLPHKQFDNQTRPFDQQDNNVVGSDDSKITLTRLISPNSSTSHLTIHENQPTAYEVDGIDTLSNTEEEDSDDNEGHIASSLHSNASDASSESSDGLSRAKIAFLRKFSAKDNGDHDDGGEGNDEEDEFAEVKRAINFEAIKNVAHKYRARELDENTSGTPDATHELSCEINPEPMYGSSNLIYMIRWSDAVKWVVRIPRRGCRFTALDAARMDSEYGTMEFIRKNTKVPVPRVYFSTWNPERAGVAFALMSYVEGDMLFRFWHSPSTTTDQKLATLTSIANHMADLSKLKFSDTGILYFDKDEAEPRIGQAIETVRAGFFDRWGSLAMKPRHESLKEAFADCLEKLTYPSKRAEIDRPVLRIAIESMPEFLESKNQYTISPPDFDWQNVMVKENGEVTGFIDWDETEIAPMIAGACRYPRWLVRDWQPGSYGWGLDEDQVDEDGTVWREESPEQLSAYRQHYLQAIVASQGQDYDPRWTSLSHILGTLSVGVYDQIDAQYNIKKLFEHTGVPFSLFEYANSFMDDDTTEKDEIIRNAFKNLCRAEWEEVEAPEQTAANELEEEETEVERTKRRIGRREHLTWATSHNRLVSRHE